MIGAEEPGGHRRSAHASSNASVSGDPRSEREVARAMLSSRPPVDHPIITRCARSSPELPSFAEGSPYLHPEYLELFLGAVRDDVSLMTVEPARKIFRQIDPQEPYPLPESCTPYVDANSLGFYLRPFLPIVFVRTSLGELLLEARVALKYLRENQRRFEPILERVEHYARRIFRPEAAAKASRGHPRLFSDVVQPYSSFTDRHLSMRAGLWVQTPPGVSTVVGPLINHCGPLSILSGAIETDWHHFELFVVIEIPAFEEQVLLIEPDAALAQLYFVARAAQDRVELRFSSDDPGADPQYARAWDALGARLVRDGKGTVAERGGVASVQLGCPHCYVSVTAAAEGGVSPNHVIRRGFNPAYKILKHEYHDLRKEDAGGNSEPHRR